MQGSNILIGKNMRIERERLGLGLRETAKALGIKLSDLRAYEAGKLEFGMPLLNRSAELFDCSIKAFFRFYEPLQQVRFRSRQKLKSREAVLNKCSLRLEDYAFLLEDFTPSDRLEVLRGYCQGLSPERSAAELRWELNLTETEVLEDLASIVKACGALLVPFDYADDAVSGLSCIDSELGPVVFANTNACFSTEHIRFSIAHELGHLLLHSGDYREDALLSNTAEMELEANAFAGQFLMPDRAFAAEYGHASEPLFTRVMRLKRRFGMSCSAVLYRISLTDQEIYKKFNNAFQRTTGQPFKRNVEPYPMPPIDLGLQALVEEAFRQERMTSSRVAEMLECSLTDALDLIREWGLD